jgi:hypothetical protein
MQRGRSHQRSRGVRGAETVINASELVESVRREGGIRTFVPVEDEGDDEGEFVPFARRQRSMSSN